MMGLTTILLMTATMGPWLTQETPPSEPATPQEKAPVAPSPEQRASLRVDEILTDQERAGQQLRGVACKVTYIDTDELNMTVTRRYGFVKYLRTSGNPLFWIEFQKQVTDDMVATSRVWYVFNGASLMEARERDKALIERQVVAPGETMDLFDLDSAPFPMPFGQKKQEILKHFTVKLAPPRPGDPEGTDHLICTPRPESHMSRRYERLEFFVLRDIHLPRRIVTVESGGSQSTEATFPDLSVESLRQKLTPDDFAEPAVWKNYARTVEKFENESSLKKGVRE